MSPRAKPPPPPGIPVPTPGGQLFNVNGLRVPLTVKGVLSETIAKGGMPRWSARQAAEFADAHWAALSELPSDARVDAIAASPWSDDRRKLDDELRAIAGAFWATGELPDVDALDDDVGPLWVALLAWMQGHDVQPVLWDRIVYDPVPARQCVDRVHLVAQIGGQTWLVLIKARHGPYREDQLKLAFQRYAPVLVAQDGRGADTWPRIDRCGVLHIRPLGAALIPQRVGPVERGIFRVTYRLARWLRTKPKPS